MTKSPRSSHGLEIVVTGGGWTPVTAHGDLLCLRRRAGYRRGYSMNTPEGARLLRPPTSDGQTGGYGQCGEPERRCREGIGLMGNGDAVDVTARFDAMTTPGLVVDPTLRVVALNAAWARLELVSQVEVVGRPLAEVVPGEFIEPHNPMRGGSLPASVAHVLASGEPDVISLQSGPAGDGDATWAQRRWRLSTTPLLDGDGQVMLLLLQMEDVTDDGASRLGEGEVDEEARTPCGCNLSPGEAALHEATLGRRRAESRLYDRDQELRLALEVQTQLSQRLAGMMQVALRLTAAQTLTDLIDVVVDSGMSVLGAGGGAVAVRTSREGGDGQGLELTLTESLGGHAQRRYSRLSLSSSLPVAVAARTGRVIMLRDRDESVAFSTEMAEAVRSTGLGTWVAMPLQTAGRSLGSMIIGWREPRDFSTADMELMTALAAQCAQSLAVVQAREHERRRAHEQRRLSETLQRSLLTEPFEPDHLQIAVRYIPAAAEAQIGGDWYDCFVGPDGITTLVVGDVGGHDRDAAAAMAQIRNLLRGVSITMAGSPAAVLSGLDRAMMQLGVGVLATAVLAQVEQSDAERARGLRTLRWSNAGHPPPILLHQDGAVTALQTTPDLLLGLVPDLQRSNHTITLEPGTSVFFYTDGLIERRGASLQDGLDWLCTVLKEVHELPIDEICDAVLARVTGPPEDDIALLLLRAHPEDVPRPPEAGPPVLPTPTLGAGG